MSTSSAIPVIDLFAGPGGLGEGFASFKDRDASVFRIGLSVEKDQVAHRTLTLRAAFRALRGSTGEDRYYEYVRGEISGEEFMRIPAVASALAHAREEAKQLELGKTSERHLDNDIKRVLGGTPNWVLIGGPPCQAYSLAGRSRRANDATFEQDEKHFLYREYLRIIKAHAPAVFVMENVKGLLSSQHSGSRMFTRILDDLSRPAKGLDYELRSAVVPDLGLGLAPEDYVIQAEDFGVPQRRHRVILIGVRSDVASASTPFLAPGERLSVWDAIGDLPSIRSRLSSDDSIAAWRDALKAAVAIADPVVQNSEVRNLMRTAARLARELHSSGERFIRYASGLSAGRDEFSKWVIRPKLGGYAQHSARSHMASDLARYLFASSYAQAFATSPTLGSFPKELLPAHRNAHTKAVEAAIPFNDRFRVQCVNDPASTIVSHIAKDGHYYIHYDPSQCRSLTVREAARIQTFPDDYFFEGNRTQQYTQVGNAVPPLLATKIAGLVHATLSADSDRSTIPARGVKAA